jgi:hypothetical protein
MELQAQVLAEDVRVSNGVEYVTVTCMESSPNPLLQMVDYNLRQDEKQHKGKLVGKLVKLKVQTIRAIFSGRPQLSGSLELLAAK